MWVRAVMVTMVLVGMASCDDPASIVPDGHVPDDVASVGGTTRFVVTPRRLLGNGRAKAKLTLVLADGEVANQPVTLTVEPAAAIEPATGTTDANGTFTATLTSTTVGMVAITVNAGGRKLTGSLEVTRPCPDPLVPGQPYVDLGVPIVADFNGDDVLDLVGVGRAGHVGFASGNGDGSFQPVETAGLDGGSVTAADLDGDGVLDLVATSYDAQFYTVVAVVGGNGDGTFGPPAKYPVPQQPGRIATGDFDHDGHIDVAVFGVSNEQSSPTIGVLFGKGDGTLESVSSIPTTTMINNEVALAVADIDGDGDSDLLSSDVYSPKVVVNTSNGDRTFQPPREIALPGSAGLGTIALADVNADGKLDLLLGRYVSNELAVLRGTGGGNFTPAASYPSGGFGLAIGDVDGDGKLDVLATRGNALLVNLGDGQGGFSSAIELASTPSGFVALGDIDDDGDLDVVSSPGSQGLIGGGLSATSVFQGDGTGHLVVAGAVTSPVQASAVADFDGDGNLDVVGIKLDYMISAHHLQIQRGRGDGTFEAPIKYPLGPRPLNMIPTMAAADIDGDLDMDVVFTSETELEVASNNGTGAFLLTTLASLPGQHRYHAMMLVDVDRDGALDVATTYAPWGAPYATLAVYRGRGDGTFEPAYEQTTQHEINFLAAGDFGTGVVDLVGSPALVRFPGIGDGTFATETTIAVTGSVFRGGIVVDDITGDGALDVIACPLDLSVYAGNADGTFAPAYGVAHYGAGNPHAVVDFDGDGVKDIVGGDGQLSITLGRADGTFREPLYYPTGLSDAYQPAVVADFDKDGLPDISTVGGVVMQRACTP